MRDGEGRRSAFNRAYLIRKSSAIDAFATRAIPCGEVAALDHELLDHPVESASLDRRRWSPSVGRFARVRSLLWAIGGVSVANDDVRTLKPNPASPVQSCLKFSAVFGTSLPKRPMTIRPDGTPPISISKYTFEVTSPTVSDDAAAAQNAPDRVAALVFGARRPSIWLTRHGTGIARLFTARYDLAFGRAQRMAVTFLAMPFTLWNVVSVVFANDAILSPLLPAYMLRRATRCVANAWCASL